MLRFWRKSATGPLWLLMGLVETAVTVPWLVWVYALGGVESWPEALPGAWLPLLIYLAAVAWELGSPAESRGKGSGRVWALAFGVAAAYLVAYELLPVAVRPGSRLKPSLALAVVPVAAYLWYQGSLAAAEGLDFGRIYTRFVRQCLITMGTVLVLMMSGVANDDRVQVTLFWSLFLLAGAGLSLLATTRERALKQEQASIGETGLGQKAISPGLVWVVLGLLGGTLAASYTLSVQRLAQVGRVLADLIHIPLTWLLDILFLILVRWFVLLFLVVNWIRLHVLFPKQRGPEDADLPGRAQFGPPVDLGDKVYRDSMPYFRAVVLVAVIVVAVVMLYRLQSRRRANAAEDLDEERISLGFWSGLLGDLSALVAGLRPHRAGPTTPELVSEAPLDPKDPRALFRRLQIWGLTIGRARRLSETPTAYAEALAELRPEAGEAAVQVSDLYNRTRYGEQTPPDAAAAAALQAFQRLAP